ncbi:MAG: 30S ribosomal protein S17 [Candidatus Altimarinota bacterium]
MRTKTGTVTSAKMNKTIVVSVNTYKIHPKYKKRYGTTKKFYAHDENGVSKEGDTVTISECRPMSKLKRWKVLEVNGQSVQS